MAVHTISKGLDLPLRGEPKQSVSSAPAVARVALVADDYVGMKPRMVVAVGEQVRRGQLLFEDRKTPGVGHTAPGAGTVVAIHRGQQRALVSVVIELSSSEAAGKPVDDDFAAFATYRAKPPDSLERPQVMALLAESGLLTAFRTRPYGRVPSPADPPPHSVFVTAIDTHPHAPSVEVALAGREKDFEAGLAAVAKLSATTYLCKRAGSPLGAGKVAGIQVEEFAGPHPSGTVGLHIHLIDPVYRQKTVWHVGYQDVVAIGRLFTTGRLELERVVALAGPTVRSPRLLRTRVGAELAPLVAGELEEVENRVISGSVLSGRTAMGDTTGFLGRFHLQISCLREGRERKFLGWMTPGTEVFSTSGAYVSSFIGQGRKFDLTTALNGGHRAQVPIGMYERVFPFDILPTFLLRSILADDVVRAEELGVLELDEEDVALCTFVCPNKHDYTTVLRRNLEQIRKEG